MKKLILDNKNYVIVLNKLQELCKHPFKFGDMVITDGVVKKHHMFNIDQSKSCRLGRKALQLLILFSFNGSGGFVLKEGDSVIINGNTIIESQEYDCIGEKLKNTSVNVFKKCNPTKEQLEHSKYEAEWNKEYADAYWKSVEAEQNDLLNNLLFQDDDFYGGEYYE